MQNLFGSDSEEEEVVRSPEKNEGDMETGLEDEMEEDHEAEDNKSWKHIAAPPMEIPVGFC